jgi:hypothetical protein
MKQLYCVIAAMLFRYYGYGWRQHTTYTFRDVTCSRNFAPVTSPYIHRNQRRYHVKTLREDQHWGLVLARQCTGSPDTCNLEETGFQCLDHPPYSPDLAPSDYHLFPGLKKKMKGHHFSSDAEVTVAAETWLDRQFSENFWVPCKSQRNGLRSVLSFVGSMLNKYRVCSL